MFASLLRRLLPRAHRSLFADPVVRRLMPAFALCDLGDGMSTVAVAWLALTLDPTGSAGPLVGIAVAAYVLPGVAGAFLLGRWLRPLSARRLLVANGWLRAVPLGTIPLAHAAGALTPALYVALLAVSSLLHAWGRAGRNAVLAPVLGEEQRIAANSVLSTSTWVSVIAGPALAGLLAAAVSPAWIIGLDALSFAALAIRTGRTSLPVATPAPERSPGAADSRQALGIVLRQPELLGMLIVTWIFNLGFGPVEVALPLFVTHDLRAGPGLLGTYWALFGVGAAGGALALGAVRRLPLWPVMLGIIAVHGLALLPFAQHAGPVPSLAGFAAAGIVYGPYSALSSSLLQERVPATHLTTVLAVQAAVLLTASPAGAVSGGFLLAHVRPAALIAACGIVMIALAALAAMARRIRRAPRPTGRQRDGHPSHRAGGRRERAARAVPVPPAAQAGDGADQRPTTA